MLAYRRSAALLAPARAGTMVVGACDPVYPALNDFTLSGGATVATQNKTSVVLKLTPRWQFVSAANQAREEM